MKAPLSLLLAGAAMTAGFLLFDYPNWQARQAEKKLNSGDLSGALADLATLEKVPGRAAMAEYNRGVVLCGMRNYSAAIISFQRSAASGDSALRSRALYNAGTARIMEAGKSVAAKSRTEALLHGAVADLQQSMALTPSDDAAKANLALAHGRLVALAKKSGQNRGNGGAESEQRQESDRTQARRQGAPKVPDSTEPKPGQGTDRQQEGGRKRLAAVDRNQALRMLDDAKGRETLRSALAVNQKAGENHPPEKDW